jgi:1-deoxy-D-xylulose-5-phosphate reductoisomerase
MKGLCILGSTGSVGANTLCVVRGLPGRFRVVALSAGRNLDLLAQQVKEFAPEVAVVGNHESIEPLRNRIRALGAARSIRVLAGPEGQVEAATLAEVDFVVSASHGITGLVATYEAVCAGKAIGLANKETLVVAGELVTKAARARGVEVMPIDSEHSAVHQCLRSGQQHEVRRLILTASGGPFLKTPEAKFASITPEEALKHPVWKMGGRITVDSATLMNKGLEIIEARWLFGLDSAAIDVMIHPESIVHSMIEFCDGAVMAQLSVADMRIPIQYALTYPDRVPSRPESTISDTLRLDLLSMRCLHFEQPDSRRFPCLELGRKALESGGALPCVLNAADEVTVEEFLSGRLRFPDIPRVIDQVMAETPSLKPSSLADILECDRDARQRTRDLAGTVATRSMN